MARRYSKATQYGGLDSDPQRFPDGSPIELDPSEAARVLRATGLQGGRTSTGEVKGGVKGVNKYTADSEQVAE